MLTFAAITPHTPLLIPSIGKENVYKLSKTTEALETLALELEASKPDVIVVISSHATRHENAFSINLHDEYRVDFSEFGDMATTKEFFPDLEFITHVQRASHDAGVGFTLDSSAALDYGTGVPLWHLFQKIPNIPIVPVCYSELDRKTHVKFGGILKEVIERSKKRVAVLASGDLSHCLTNDSPGGFTKEGNIFDRAIEEAVKNTSLSSLISIDEHILEQAQSCMFEQLLVLFGVLERKNTRAEILSYEAPFGVGYLVAQFHISNI